MADAAERESRSDVADLIVSQLRNPGGCAECMSPLRVPVGGVVGASAFEEVAAPRKDLVANDVNAFIVVPAADTTVARVGDHVLKGQRVTSDLDPGPPMDEALLITAVQEAVSLAPTLAGVVPAAIGLRVLEQAGLDGGFGALADTLVGHQDNPLVSCPGCDQHAGATCCLNFTMRQEAAA